LVDRHQQPPDANVALGRALARGDLADQRYLTKQTHRRGEPAILLRGGASMVARLYRYRCEPDHGDQSPTAGIIARYARGTDYHKVLKTELFDDMAGQLRARYGSSLRLRTVTDSAPVLERDLAYRQGLGWFGRQSSIIHPAFGAASLLAELVVDRPIETPAPALHPDRCGSCRACVQVCPTAAIAADGYRVDSRRCISYWTIEQQGVIPRWIMERMGRRVFGCDDCTLICPWNSTADAPLTAALEARPQQIAPDLVDLLEDCQPDRFAARFGDTSLFRTGPAALARNVVVGLASVDTERARAAVDQALASHPSPVVRATAVWARHRQGREISRWCSDPAPEVAAMALAVHEGQLASPPSPVPIFTP
jgi:epoxyqueuosine reductase